MKKLFALAAFVAVASLTVGAGYADIVLGSGSPVGPAQDTATLEAIVQSYVSVDINQASLDFGTINPSAAGSTNQPFTVDTATNLNNLALSASVSGLTGLNPAVVFTGTGTSTQAFAGAPVGVVSGVPGQVSVSWTTSTAPGNYNGVLTVTASANN